MLPIFVFQGQSVVPRTFLRDLCPYYSTTLFLQLLKISQRLLQQIRPQAERGFENDKNKLSLNRFFANSLEMAKIIGYLADACQLLLLFAEMKTNTKAKAKRVMKAAYTQLSLDL